MKRRETQPMFVSAEHQIRGQSMSLSLPDSLSWRSFRSVFISCVLPWDLFIPLAMLFLLGERWVSCSPSLQELSLPLPEQLPESEELLLICSITSTSARSSRLMSSSWGSGEGLSLVGEVLAPAPGLMGVRNCAVSWLALTDCCSIRAWILLLPSALVFLTCMLLLSFSNINSPVSWLMMRTQSFWYDLLLPLNTVIGGVEPGMCGNVMVTSSPFPTCNSPSQDVSMDAGLKSYLMVWKEDFGLFSKLSPSINTCSSLSSGGFELPFITARHIEFTSLTQNSKVFGR